MCSADVGDLGGENGAHRPAHVTADGNSLGGEIGLKGGGGDDGRRACDDVGGQRHCASPGGGKGRSMTWASRAAATTAGGPSTASAARDTAPLPYRVTAIKD